MNKYSAFDVTGIQLKDLKPKTMFTKIVSFKPNMIISILKTE